MKIVVLDGYTENPGDISWAPLEALGEVTVYDRTSYVDDPVIAERLGDAEIAVINKTPISKATIDACPNLKAVAVLATGYNVVDYEYAKEKGIPVLNVPVYGTDNVSQFAVSLLLEAQRFRPRRRVGIQRRLVLLALPDDRSLRQDRRHHRPRQDRRQYRKDPESHERERHRLRRIPV